MKKHIGYVLFICSLVLLSSAVRAEACDSHSAKTSASFEKMKQLAGRWKEINPKMDDKKMDVIYKLTSGGTALVETIAPGTDHEMATVYYDEAGKLTMTHYCILGNHPVMQLKKETSNQLIFDSGKNDPLKKEPHMSGLEITFVDPNTIEHNWSMIQLGKEGSHTVFRLEREL